MARQIPIPITDLLDNLPVTIPGLSSVLQPLFDLVRLANPGTADGTVTLTSAQDAAIRSWFTEINRWLGATTLDNLPAVQAVPDVIPVQKIGILKAFLELQDVNFKMLIRYLQRSS